MDVCSDFVPKGPQKRPHISARRWTFQKPLHTIWVIMKWKCTSSRKPWCPATETQKALRIGQKWSAFWFFHEALRILGGDAFRVLAAKSWVFGWPFPSPCVLSLPECRDSGLLLPVWAPSTCLLASHHICGSFLSTHCWCAHASRWHPLWLALGRYGCWRVWAVQGRPWAWPFVSAPFQPNGWSIVDIKMKCSFTSRSSNPDAEKSFDRLRYRDVSTGLPGQNQKKWSV